MGGKDWDYRCRNSSFSKEGYLFLGNRKAPSLVGGFMVNHVSNMRKGLGVPVPILWA